MSGFWIYHGSKYARVTQDFEDTWIIPGYAWLCLNVPKSVWRAFVFYLLIYFLIQRSFSSKVEICFFFYSIAGGIWFCLLFSCKISDLSLPLGTEGAAGSESYPSNDITHKYIYDAFLMIYLSILLWLFFHFPVLQRS